MNIAIVGAGFAGLATCWYLLQKKQVESVTIFDAKGIGKGSSGIATGLLNPYMGPKAKLAWPGLNGMEAALELVSIATKALGSPVIIDRGVFRPALSEEQDRLFKELSNQTPDFSYWSKERCSEELPSFTPHSGLFIQRGVSIDASRYLEGLWLACQGLGAKLVISSISSLSELESSFDQIILAIGGGISIFKDISIPRLEFVKGQSLTLDWPKEFLPFHHPLNGYKHLLMNSDRRSCIIGATYERSFTSIEPDIEIAKGELLPEAENFFPWLGQSAIISCQSGVRVAGPDRHLPILGRLNQKSWLYTALGSKGLLQHAVSAKLLCKAIIAQNQELIPIELRRWLQR